MLIVLALLVVGCRLANYTLMNATIMNRNETLEIPFLPYFLNKLTTFEQTCDAATHDLFHPNISQKPLDITSLNMTFNNLQLKDYTVLKALTVRTQPIKIYLTNESLVFLAIFNDNLKKSHTVVFSNLSDYNQQNLSCTDMTLDSVNYTVYALCHNKSASYIMKINLTRNSRTSMISGLQPFNTYKMPTNIVCKTGSILKLVYLPVFRDDKQYIDSLFYYCNSGVDLNAHYQPNLASPKPLALKKFNCSFNIVPPFWATQSCCINVNMIEYDGHGGLIMVNTSSVWLWNGSCTNRQVLVANVTDFIELKVGAAKYIDDIYVLTRNKLFLKFPGISNTLEIDISEAPSK